MNIQNPGALVLALSAFYATASAQLTKTRIVPSKDSAVSQHEPNSKWGSSSTLFTRHHYSSSNNKNWEVHSYLDFALPSIPRDAKVVQAILTIHYSHDVKGSRKSAGHVIQAHEAQRKQWIEASITWNNRPGYKPRILDSTAIPNNSAPMFWDVSKLVQERVAASHSSVGIVIRDSTNSPGINLPFAQFHAREYSNAKLRPHLDISYYPNSSLKASTNSISGASGGSVFFRICAKTKHAGDLYILLGSLSGSIPGLLIPGIGIMPVTPDAFMDFTLTQPNSPSLVKTLGILDGFGNSVSQFVMPGSIPVLIGSTFTFGALTFVKGRPVLITNPVNIKVL
jgi:hypothetical protein